MKNIQSDRTKQAQEVIFSRKQSNPSLFFNNSAIKVSSNQKHLGLTLDSKLSFNNHINDKIHQANKGVDLLRKPQTILPRTTILAIYKSFIRAFLDHAGVVYDEPSNARIVFQKKNESVQYNAALAIGSSCENCNRN